MDRIPPVIWAQILAKIGDVGTPGTAAMRGDVNALKRSAPNILNDPHSAVSYTKITDVTDLPLCPRVCLDGRLRRYAANTLLTLLRKPQ
jgi:hypothetical protein